MKKLSVVLALVLCVTIGGVFANWIYAGTSASSAHHHLKTSISLSSSSTTTAIGTYDVLDGDDQLSIRINQKAPNSTAADAYDTVLSITGTIKVTFSPDELFTGEPTATFNLASVNENIMSVKYGETAILSNFDTSAQTLSFDKNEETGKYEAIITAEMISNLIAINTFNLPTQTAYKAFETALQGIGQIGLDIVDTTVIA